MGASGCLIHLAALSQHALLRTCWTAAVLPSHGCRSFFFWKLSGGGDPWLWAPWLGCFTLCEAFYGWFGSISCRGTCACFGVQESAPGLPATSWELRTATYCWSCSEKHPEYCSSVCQAEDHQPWCLVLFAFVDRWGVAAGAPATCIPFHEFAEAWHQRSSGTSWWATKVARATPFPGLEFCKRCWVGWWFQWRSCCFGRWSLELSFLCAGKKMQGDTYQNCECIRLQGFKATCIRKASHPNSVGLKQSSLQTLTHHF